MLSFTFFCQVFTVKSPKLHHTRARILKYLSDPDIRRKQATSTTSALSPGYEQRDDEVPEVFRGRIDDVSPVPYDSLPCMAKLGNQFVSLPIHAVGMGRRSRRPHF